MKAGAKKADCTPEEWAEHLAKVRAYRLANHEAYKARVRAYAARPEVQATRRTYDKTDHYKALRKIREAKPEQREKKRANRIKRQSLINVQQRTRRTGFTPELLAETLVKQNNCCAICFAPFGPGQRICADHCHDKNVPRGLLCHYCNVLEGIIKKIGMEPSDYFVNFNKYLSNPPVTR